MVKLFACMAVPEVVDEALEESCIPVGARAGAHDQNPAVSEIGGEGRVLGPFGDRFATENSGRQPSPTLARTATTSNPKVVARCRPRGEASREWRSPLSPANRQSFGVRVPGNVHTLAGQDVDDHAHDPTNDDEGNKGEERPGGDEELPTVDTAHFTIDLAAKRVRRDGRDVPLTATEWQVVELLARNPGRLVTQRQLLEKVWGLRDTKSGVVRVFLATIRRNLSLTRPIPAIS